METHFKKLPNSSHAQQHRTQKMRGLKVSADILHCERRGDEVEGRGAVKKLVSAPLLHPPNSLSSQLYSPLPDLSPLLIDHSPFHNDANDLILCQELIVLVEKGMTVSLPIESVIHRQVSTVLLIS
ncbi:unnamed protein product [Brugia timori]|uniref:Bm10059 n=2 Tax=Brugia TaxID=6278 RepID=A0A1I9G2N7_BRUMA|nr:Bm10059 [Brugia malayi]VDO23624.1 unnamed protein product [Brugia timori]